MDSPTFSRENSASGNSRTNATTRAHISGPKPRDVFIHAKPWQFGRDGRKFKIVSERLRRLSRVLARFDRSGDCRSIFPAVTTILDRLRSAELNYPKDGAPWLRRMAWSRRTVFVYLQRLERAKISTSSGLTSYRGTKRRELHAEKLLLVPVESCTPTRRESCTRSKSLDSKKLQRGRKKQNHPAEDAVRTNPSELISKSNGNPPVEETSTAKPNPAAAYAARVARIRAVAKKIILARKPMDPDGVDYVLAMVIDRTRRPIHNPNYMVTGFFNQLADDLAQFESYGASEQYDANVYGNLARLHRGVEARHPRPGTERPELGTERRPWPGTCV